MSINASGTNYMSNATILEWMESKSENLYEKMRTSMDQSNTRVDAEDALNDIKAKMAESESERGGRRAIASSDRRNDREVRRRISRGQ